MSDAEEVSTKVKTKRRRRGNAKAIQFWSGECWYSVVKERAIELGWNSTTDESMQSKANMFWVDRSKMLEFYEIMQPWQTINHFPGMPNIANKNKMGQNLNRMLKLFPKEYSFYPRTWILPAQMADFRNQFDNHNNALDNKIFIIKPDTGCQGKGIFLTKTLDKVPMGENVVAQTYIGNPLLIDGFKFDLRIYVFVASVKPLRVYLFHDGLVRMCTEEYVKPNKQNIDMSCMHLTNYAVNKKNSNFQQPGDDEGDSGHKRSLQWFMDWIRAEHGDAKANWVWKRMGVIIMRTLLSIMPILSREYDQHFKSFTGVPVDKTKIGHSTSTGDLAGQQGEDADTKESGNNSESEVEREKETGAGSAKGRGNTPTETTSTEEATAGPKMRGSRCFEVLGYDIMLDSNLNPWVIEVNHLPSFGTDSPMDQDIKQRLMEQVFSVLPVMADDQVAYAAHHKAESEKRLVAQNRASAQAQKEREAKEKEAKEKAKPPLRPKPPRRDSTPNTSPAASAETENQGDSNSNGASRRNEDASEDAGASPVVGVSPARLAEIKAALQTIYAAHCPEKMHSIDHLLSKYETREEEFLKFVLQKYSVDASTVPGALAPNEGVEESKSPAKPGEVISSTRTQERAQEHGKAGRNHERETSKRQSRSMSPIRSQSMASSNSRGDIGSASATGSGKRAAAAWKGSEEEDAKFRAEVLAVHVPAEDDEWLAYETSKLLEFTRLFPPLKGGKPFFADAEAGDYGSVAAATEGDADAQDAEGGEEEDEAGGIKVLQAKSASGGKFKAASYNEIICQAFLQDKYMSMRLHNPLAARARLALDDSGGSGFLPSIDASAASKPPFSSSFGNSGKGVGWKAPPEPPRKAAPREPGIGQVDAANRLAQGLSVKEVKQSVRKRLAAENAAQTRHYPLVLDRDQGSAQTRSTTVIRQQMFHFDPEHREQMLAAITSEIVFAQGGGASALPNAAAAGGGNSGGTGLNGGVGSGVHRGRLPTSGLDSFGSITDDQSLVGGAGAYRGGVFGRHATLAHAGAQVAGAGGRGQGGVAGTGGRQTGSGSYAHASIQPHRPDPVHRKSYNLYKDYDYAL